MPVEIVRVEEVMKFLLVEVEESAGLHRWLVWARSSLSEHLHLHLHHHPYAHHSFDAGGKTKKEKTKSNQQQSMTGRQKTNRPTLNSTLSGTLSR